MVIGKIIKVIQWVAIVVGVMLVIFVWNTKDKDISIKDFLYPGTPVMKIGGVPLRVDVAETDAERTLGLSGRSHLDAGSGLLFIFPNADYHSMWMKDMTFPIDIIWISEDLRVVSINEGVTPDSFPKTFRPSAPARYAVETNVQYVETFGIRQGQTVELPVGTLIK